MKCTFQLNFKVNKWIFSLTKFGLLHKIIWININHPTRKSILTKREKEVFNLLVTNKTTSEIAEKLEISEKTVRNHISNVMQKLGVKGRTGAIIELLKIGEISL